MGMKTLTAMVVGGALVYFLDPVSGSGRRARAKRGLENALGVTRRAAEQSGRSDVAEAIGKVQRVTESGSPVVVGTSQST